MTDLPAPIPRLNLVQLGELAREIATDVRDRVDVLRDYGLTEAHFEALQAQTPLGMMLKVAIQEWNSALSARDRVRILAANALEEQLPVLAARMGDNKEPLSGAVEAGKLIARLADIGEGQRNAGANERFTITINLGDEKTITLENAVNPVEVRPLPEGASPEAEIPSFLEGEGSQETVREDAESPSPPPDVQQVPPGEGAYESLLAFSKRIVESKSVQSEPETPGSPS